MRLLRCAGIAPELAQQALDAASAAGHNAGQLRQPARDLANAAGAGGTGLTGERGEVKQRDMSAAMRNTWSTGLGSDDDVLLFLMTP